MKAKAFLKMLKLRKISYCFDLFILRLELGRVRVIKETLFNCLKLKGLGNGFGCAKNNSTSIIAYSKRQEKCIQNPLELFRNTIPPKKGLGTVIQLYPITAE